METVTSVELAKLNLSPEEHVRLFDNSGLN